MVILINLARRFTDEEVWMPVPGYELMELEASNQGGLRRHLYYTPRLHTNGYRVIGIKRVGKSEAVVVHQAVCAAFHGPKPFARAVVRHLDGNREHNHPDNLAWGTYVENSADRTRHGRTLFGEKNARAKLTDAKVVQLRTRVAAGETEASVASDLGVFETTVNKIVRGQMWAHIGGPVIKGLRARGTAQRNHKLTEDLVRKIRATCKTWEDCKAFAKANGIVPQTVQNVLSGRNWSWLDEDKVGGW